MSRNQLLFRIVLALCIGFAVLSLCSCKKKKGTGGGGSWLVGEDGLMANLSAAGERGPDYSLDVPDDLLAIACRGADTGFVVGERGLLLRTFDGGESWDEVDVGSRATLRAVAVGEAASEVVYVAGDGLFLRSSDSADTFQPADSAGRAWVSLATDHSGAAALLVAADGALWRYQAFGGALVEVLPPSGLRAVAITGDGVSAAAVGDAGALWRSDDGGLRWRREDLAVDGTLLRDVWIAHDRTVVAVGDRGLIARRAADGTVTVQHPVTAALHALHIGASGHSFAAGDAGTVLLSHDAGQTWTRIDAGIDRAILALDEIDGEGHF
jgi:photosystem II stability/assembly factor-like uncharacterized protein